MGKVARASQERQACSKNHSETGGAAAGEDLRTHEPLEEEV